MKSLSKSFAPYFRPELRGFIVFQIVFFALMWLSKTLHLLYFEKEGAVANFGLSYSSMALAGYFSFGIGHLCDRWGFRRMLIAGGLLYGVGLALRTEASSSVVAISSGLIAGFGASSVLCALRVWMLSFAPSEERTLLVGLRSSTTAFGTAVGCAVAGLAPAFFSLRSILGFVGVAMALLVLPFFFAGQDKGKNAVAQNQEKKPSLLEAFRLSPRIALIATILGASTGFYVSFISPYLPLILKEKGFDLVSIGLSTGSLALVRFFADPIISQWISRHRERSLSIFLAAEGGIALATAVFLLPFGHGAFLMFLVLRSLLLGFSAISEEVVWLGIFPKENVGLFFGLNQSGFFLGDFFGGLSNGFLYQKYGLNACIAVVLVVMLFNVALFLRLLAGRQSGALRPASVPC